MGTATVVDPAPVLETGAVAGTSTRTSMYIHSCLQEGHSGTRGDTGSLVRLPFPAITRLPTTGTAAGGLAARVRSGGRSPKLPTQPERRRLRFPAFEAGTPVVFRLSACRFAVEPRWAREPVRRWAG